MARPVVNEAGDGAERVTKRPSVGGLDTKLELQAKPAAETPVVVVAKSADAAPADTAKEAQNKGDKLFDGALGVAFAPLVYLAYAIAKSGRDFEHGKSNPSYKDEDALTTIRTHFWSGLRPIVLVTRGAQGLCLPVAGVGAGIDWLVAPLRKKDADPTKTFSGLPRTVFGYSGTAVDAVGRVVLSPLAAIGVGIKAAAKPANRLLNIAPGVDFGNHYYSNLARVGGLGVRLLASPAFAMDEIFEGFRSFGARIGYKPSIRNPENLPGYWRVCGRGLVDAVKTPFALVAVVPSLVNVAFEGARSKLTNKPFERKGF